MDKPRKDRAGLSEGMIERKFVVPYRYKKAFLRSLIHGARVPLTFAQSHLRTIYYDDEHLENYQDACDGQLSRRKFRLREYCNIKDAREGARYSIEVKIRFNMAVIKEKHLVYGGLPDGYFPRTFQDAVFECEKAEGRTLENIRSHMSGRTLRADIMITYTRHRFHDRKHAFRYNFDTDIAVRRLSGGRKSITVFRPDYHIFEIKGPGGEGPLGMPMLFGLEPLSKSKYMWAKETGL